MSRDPARTLSFAEAFDLPLSVDLTTAARALAVCPATAYRLIHAGRFPCQVLRLGRQYRIPTASLMRALGVENLPVYAADIDQGAGAAVRADWANHERGGHR
ncbi:helix-turn-helix domain-containing protein [Streptomyces sp. NPDC058305]|uniref:helix-turn-helix domain-containing protein n=1 Tax=Streptomyces sp. NPDC058305 TaxID=3346438 RepID=UPI0036E16926